MVRKNCKVKLMLSFLAIVIGMIIVSSGIVYSQYDAEKMTEEAGRRVLRKIEGNAMPGEMEPFRAMNRDEYVEHFQANIESIDAAMESQDRIASAIDLGDVEMAKMEIEETKRMLESVRESLNSYVMQESPVVNKYCPITGEEIDPNNVPQEWTRMCNGKKVGFCNESCGVEWDGMSDLEKRAKLEVVMPEGYEPTESKKLMDRIRDDSSDY